MSPKAAAAGQRARNRAGTTPGVVLRAFLDGPVEVGGGIVLQPFTLGMLWLLQDIDSPFVRPPETDPETDEPIAHPAKFHDIARALFILSKPDEAFSAWQEGDLECLDRCAFELAGKIKTTEMSAMVEGIGWVIAAGSAPAPGGAATGGGENPPAGATA